ncbi:MAG: hypothetical protein JWR52_968 [Marmoricola sp.]|nr:hypothetical protein [Marmoricola sp.]
MGSVVHVGRCTTGDVGQMRVEEALVRLGGMATHKSLRRLVTARSLRKAVEDERVVRDGRGRYSLRSVDDAIHAANALAGTVSHSSAAHLWGWELKTPPDRPHVTVPRNRKVDPRRRRSAHVHWADISAGDVRAPGMTSPMRTLTDCLTTLPFDAALAVADSALRHEAVTAASLVAATTGLRGPGSGAARRVARLANGLAANPFESVLRATVLDIPGLSVVPQSWIIDTGLEVRPDLVDADLRLVLEADSHTWHSSREALRRDCRRYNALVLRGWTVLRFTWEDVMFNPHYVCGDVTRFVQHAQRSSRRRRVP